MDSALMSPAAPAVERGPRPLALARWLLLVALLVFAIVVVGGITRLTESGLSITQWNLVSGVLPPLGHADWTAEFARVRRSTSASMTACGFWLVAPESR